FDLEFTIGAEAPNVIGSTVPVDVFDDNWRVRGTATMMHQDHSNFTAWEAESESEVSIALQEPSATAPLPVLAFFFPRVKIAKSNVPAGGGTGSMVETVTLMFGPKVAASGYDGTTAIIFS